MARGNALTELPSMEQVEQERDRLRHRRRYGKTLKGTVALLVVVAAVAVLVATLWTPVLRIYGSSMSPTLTEGQIVVAVKGSDFKTGDTCALWYGNKLLVKRVIAGPGSWVDIDDSGNVYVDGALVDEPYLKEKARGDCSVDLPLQVPESKWFVLGDNRPISADSRNSALGCVSSDFIVGKIVFCIWPLNQFGPVG